MKFIVSSDYHNHAYSAYNVLTGRTRLDVGFDVIDKIYSQGYAAGIYDFLFNGDFYDQVKNLPTEVVNESVSRMLKIVMNYPDCYTFCISGNHDYATKNLYGKPAVTALKHVAELNSNFFRIIDNQTIKHPDGNVVIHGIPYYEFAEDYHKALADANRTALRINNDTPGMYHILMIHQTPSGLPNKKIKYDTDVNDPLYDPFNKVLCGHIHNKQIITSKFYLLGSTHHRDMGDVGDDKGYWILDTDADSMTFVSLRGHYPEFIPQRVKLGERVVQDGINFIYPDIIQEGLGIKLPDGTESGTDQAERYSLANSMQDLTENYWREVDGKDRDLLAIGLECLPIKNK